MEKTYNKKTTAIAIYERLGYRLHAGFLEGPAIRRAPWERITNIWRRP